MLYCIWMDRASVIQVVLSEHNLAVEEGFEQVYSALRVYSHFAYNPKTFNNDIMLIKVRNTIIGANLLLLWCNLKTLSHN